MEATAFNQENLSTWTRERPTAELSHFVTSRLANLSDIELDLN